MKKINLNMPEELLKRVDAYCEANFTNLTELFKRLLLEFLNKQEKPIEYTQLQTNYDVRYYADIIA